MSNKEFPQLIIQESAEKGSISCMLACDGKIMKTGGSQLEALDFLFKFIWVYALKCNPGLSSFFLFLQYAVYFITYGNAKKNRITGTVMELKKVLKL